MLSDINTALSDSNAEIENSSAMVFILIYHDEVLFYNMESEYYVYSIPTSDFKQIVEAWIDFLNKPPLDGPYTGNQ